MFFFCKVSGLCYLCKSETLNESSMSLSFRSLPVKVGGALPAGSGESEQASEEGEAGGLLRLY